MNYKWLRYGFDISSKKTDHYKIVHDIFLRYASQALDYCKTLSDKSWYISEDAQSFLSYRRIGLVVVVLGAPVGPDTISKKSLIQSFLTYAQSKKWIVGRYRVTSQELFLFEDYAYKRMLVGEEGTIDISSFNLSGKHKNDLRGAIKRFPTLGYKFVVQCPPYTSEEQNQIAAISQTRLLESKRKEKYFSQGRYNPETLFAQPLALLYDDQGSIVAFCNITTDVSQNSLLRYDLYRYKKSGIPNGMMNYFLIELIERARHQGYTTLSLGMVPCVDFMRSLPRYAYSFGKRISLNINTKYGYYNQKLFKSKFDTQWQNTYFCYKYHRSLGALLLALAWFFTRKGAKSK